MNQRSKFLFKNMGLLTLSNFSSKVLVFLLVPLYTSELSTGEYGIYDLIVSTVILSYPILTANIADAVMRFLMDESSDKNKVTSIGIKFIAFSICIVAVFLLVIQKLDIGENIRGLEGFIFLYYTSYVLNQFFIQFAKGLERVIDMGIASVLGTISMLVTNILFLLIFKWRLSGFFIANILSQIIPVTYFFIRLKFWDYMIIVKNDKGIQKGMLMYCIPLIVTTIGWWVNSASDKYVVSFICGIAANGILSVSYKIPGIINTLQGIFIQAWQISAIKEAGAEDTAKFYGNTFVLLSVFMTAACAWLILLTKPLAHILYAKDFYVAWKYVPFLLINSVLNCAAGFLGPILSAHKDSKSMAMSAAYGALINIIFNFILISLIGIQGATIATVISSYIIYVTRKKAVGSKIYIEEYNNILITWGLLCFQAMVEIYTSLWLIEILLMMIMLILNRKIVYKIYLMIIALIKR